MKSIETKIAEAASDYKLATKNEDFATDWGGLDALRDELFDLVAEWEGWLSDEEIAASEDAP